MIYFYFYRIFTETQLQGHCLSRSLEQIQRNGILIFIDITVFLLNTLYK